jgi:hypothetical protein
VAQYLYSNGGRPAALPLGMLPLRMTGIYTIQTVDAACRQVMRSDPEAKIHI